MDEPRKGEYEVGWWTRQLPQRSGWILLFIGVVWQLNVLRSYLEFLEAPRESELNHLLLALLWQFCSIATLCGGYLTTIGRAKPRGGMRDAW